MLSSLDFLKTAVSELLQKNEKRIAVRFTDSSFLSSHSITVLVACNEMVRNAGGEFLIAGGGEDLERYLDTLGIKDRFTLCKPSDKVLATLG